MSTLLVDELFNGIVFNQPVKIKKETNLVHVRPWIYKHGTLQDGELVLEIYDGAEMLATARLDFETINAAFTENYAHGFLRFDFDSLTLNLLDSQTEKEFTFRFYMDNHTTDSANFIGIVRQYENKIYPTYGTGVVDNEAPNDFVEPCGLELFNFRSV